MTEDNVGVCRPAILKLLMGSKNIILFKTINVKLFLSVTSLIFLALNSIGNNFHTTSSEGNSRLQQVFK